MISHLSNKAISEKTLNKNCVLRLFLILIINLISKVITDNIPDWNYKNHGNDWNNLSGSLCDPSLNNQAPLKINSSNLKYLSKEKFFFADSNHNIEATFDLEDQNNNLVLNAKDYFSITHANFFKVEIENKETGKKDQIETYYDIECKQIYFRIPGEHEINDKKFDMELQFNCTAKIQDLIHGQSLENIFNFFVAYPLNISKNDTQNNFFDDVLNNDTLALSSTFTLRSVDEIMNNYNMYDNMYFYRVKYLEYKLSKYLKLIIGSKNFFDCMIDFYWLVTENKNLKVNQKTYNKLKSLLNSTQAPEGNNRLASEKTDSDIFIIDNNFFSN